MNEKFDTLLSKATELKKNIQDTSKIINITEKKLTIQKYQKEIESFDFQDKDVLDKARDRQLKISQLEKKVTLWENLLKNTDELIEYIKICQMESENNMYGELENTYHSILQEYQTNNLDILFQDEDDKYNIFLNIRPGAGGTESHDWANMLQRLYIRWAESKNMHTNIVDFQPGEEVGVKNITLHIKGENAYGYLKSEHGVHRLVRISPFDSNAKRHTSFASVMVTPEISQNISVPISPSDIRIDTYRASGAGGQHVNKTDSAIRITHIPTKVVVSCQSERSQLRNKETAMKVLQGILYKLEKDKQKEEMEKKYGAKKQIAWGNQIRSYILHPYNMVKDLRTGYQTSNVNKVLDGDIDSFIKEYLEQIAEN